MYDITDFPAECEVLSVSFLNICPNLSLGENELKISNLLFTSKFSKILNESSDSKFYNIYTIASCDKYLITSD